LASGDSSRPCPQAVIDAFPMYAGARYLSCRLLRSIQYQADSNTDDQDPMKRKMLLALPGIALIAGGAFYWQRSHRQQASTTALALYGNVDIRQVQPAFNGSARIDRMLVSEGEAVRRGQLLATLDSIRLEQNVALLEAQVAAQQQVVARLQRGNRPEGIRKARASGARQGQLLRSARPGERPHRPGWRRQDEAHATGCRLAACR